MLTCQQLTELVTDYLEGNMSFWRRMQFRMHLAMCKHCSAFLEQMKATIKAASRIVEPPAPAAMKADLLAHFGEMGPDDDD